MKKYKISAEEFNKVSLTRISNTPSSPSQYNGARLGAEDLKKRMDAPLELFRDKLNALVGFLLGEGDDSAIAHIDTGIYEGHTISQMLKDIVAESADFASYLSVGEKSLLESLEAIGESINKMDVALGACIDKNTYEKDIDSITLKMLSHEEAASEAIEVLERELSAAKAELIESIAQALISAKKYADDEKVGKSGDQTISGALSISGDLLVGGNTYAKQLESLKVGDAVIIANADGVLLSELSGYVIRVNKEAAYAIVYDPADDCVKIGLGMYNDDSDTKVFTFLEGEAQVLATRADIADGNIPEWDNDKKTFRDSGYKVGDFAKKGDVPTASANALIGSEMGEVVALKDVSRIEHNLGVKVESKNLMPYPYTDKTKTVCGITFTDNGDGTITANGTATETASYYSTANVDYPNGTYTFSGCPSGGSTSTYTINCFCRDNNNQYLVDTLEHGDGKTFTANNGFKTIGFSLRIYKGFTAENLVFKPMYERGAKKTGYKPYLANPEAVKITTMGANLFDVSKTKDNSGNDYETYDAATNTITAHSANYSAWGSLGTLTPLLPAGTYTFLKGNGYRSALCAFSVNNEEIGDFTNYNYNQKITFTVNEPFYLKAKYMLNAASYPCSASAKDFMLLSGDVSEAEYEPYKEPIEYAYGEEIKSIYPSTTLMTDTEGAVISVEYNRDINKAFEELMNLILSLGGNVYV